MVDAAGLLRRVVGGDNAAVEAEPTLRWYQFRLRTLLIGVAALAVASAWVGHQLDWIRQRHEAEKKYGVNFSSIYVQDRIGHQRPPAAPDNAAMEAEPSQGAPKRKRRWYQFSLLSDW
jgi:hypothetical protein